MPWIFEFVKGPCSCTIRRGWKAGLPVLWYSCERRKPQEVTRKLSEIKLLDIANEWLGIPIPCRPLATSQHVKNEQLRPSFPCKRIIYVVQHSTLDKTLVCSPPTTGHRGHSSSQAAACAELCLGPNNRCHSLDSDSVLGKPRPYDSGISGLTKPGRVEACRSVWMLWPLPGISNKRHYLEVCRANPDFSG